MKTSNSYNPQVNNVLYLYNRNNALAKRYRGMENVKLDEQVEMPLTGFGVFL